MARESWPRSIAGRKESAPCLGPTALNVCQPDWSAGLAANRESEIPLLNTMGLVKSRPGKFSRLLRTSDQLRPHLQGAPLKNSRELSTNTYAMNRSPSPGAKIRVTLRRPDRAGEGEGKKGNLKQLSRLLQTDGPVFFPLFCCFFATGRSHMAPSSRKHLTQYAKQHQLALPRSSFLVDFVGLASNGFVPGSETTLYETTGLHEPRHRPQCPTAGAVLLERIGFVGLLSGNRWTCLVVCVRREELRFHGPIRKVIHFLGVQEANSLATVGDFLNIFYVGLVGDPSGGACRF